MITKAIKNLCPTATFSVIDEEYSKIIWYSNDVSMPTEMEVMAEVTRLQSQYDDEEYKELRKKEYPLIGDQLDMLYHDIKNGTLETGNWIQSVEFVKEKYPKPE
jgi:hypothetical protein